MDGKVKTSDLKEFEKQLDNVVDLDIPKVGRLSEDNVNTISSKTIKPQAPQPQQQIVKVQKNIILAFQSDASGCGFIRCFQPFSYINFVFGRNQTLMPITSCAFIHDEHILLRTRTIYFQRQMSPEHLQSVLWYKQHQANYKYRMIWEMDDHIWWEDKERKVNGVPPYNFGAPGITEAVKQASIQIMNLMDQLIVSTEFLAHYIKNELKVNVPIKIIPNHVAKYFWKDGNRKKITERITKPKVIYTGSPTHYSNEKKMYGDWENPAWREFVIKNVKDNKIDFTCFGGLPWFFEEIKDKIKVIGWLNSFQYHLGVLGEKADFGLMPLVPNFFNMGKSNLKHLEYAAARVVSLGSSYFPDREWKGPYDKVSTKLKWDCDLKDIQEMMKFYCEPDNYNKIILEQTEYLDNGYWLESKKYVDNFISVL